MAFITTDRYGGMDRHGDDADIAAVIRGLLEELEVEDSDEPDNEHAEVAVSHGDWALSVHVSGLMSLQDLSHLTSDPNRGKRVRRVPPLFRRAKTRNGVTQMMTMLARGEIERLRAKAGWVPREELPAQTGGDFFRRRRRA